MEFNKGYYGVIPHTDDQPVCRLIWMEFNKGY